MTAHSTSEAILIKAAVLTVLLGSFTAIWAAPIPACPTATLATYEADYTPAAPCAVGILDFTGFAYVNPYPTGTSALGGPAASSILVSPTVSGFDFTTVNGYGPFTATGPDGTITRFAIAYSYIIDPAPIETGARIHIDPPTPSVTIQGLYCNDSVIINYDTDPMCKDLTGFRPAYAPQSLVATNLNPDVSIVFNPPAYTQGYVETLFTLVSNGDPNHPTSFGGVSQTLYTSPEPASLSMMLGTLLIGGAYAMRRRRSRN